ncbi:MAG: hypothetical protein CMO40_04260 [Verrucomicrobiaceae bacterium]|nr:hypothetical protein [Verrucomicrobiaceae bacterium]
MRRHSGARLRLAALQPSPALLVVHDDNHQIHDSASAFVLRCCSESDRQGCNGLSQTLVGDPSASQDRAKAMEQAGTDTVAECHFHTTTPNPRSIPNLETAPFASYTGSPLDRVGKMSLPLLPFSSWSGRHP